MAVSIAIAGTGWGLTVQVVAFKKAGWEIDAIWMHSNKKIEILKDTLKGALLTNNYEEFIAKTKSSIISITSPPIAHLNQSIIALRAGKHVLCEKPTALSAKEAFEMFEEARKHPNQIAIIDHELRFLPTFIQMREHIINGFIGDVYWMDAEFASGSRLVNKVWDWWSDKSKGGGALGAVGSHLIDSLHFFTNMKITEVSGMLLTTVKERTIEETNTPAPVTSDDIFNVQLKIGSKVCGSLKANSTQAGEMVYKFVVCGTLGTIIWSSGKLYVAKAGEKKCDLLLEDQYDTSDPALNSAWGHGTLLLAKALKEKILNPKEHSLAPAATFEDGLYIQQVIDAIHSSNSNRTWITVPSHST